MGYWHGTHRPLQCLYFLLPLLVAYEIGTVLLSLQDNAEVHRILAESAIREFFGVFGVVSVHLPAITVVVVLLGWHLARKGDPLRPQWPTLAGMLVESLVLVAPLFILQLLTQRVMQGAAGGELAGLLQGLLAAGSAGTGGGDAAIGDWRSGLLLSIGAGIYEELLFRLLAIALLGLLLEDVLALPRGWAALLAVAVSSLAFAWYHFWGTSQPMDAGRFAFYTLAGVYFAGLYMLRGFGVVVATHALYDVVIVSARMLPQPPA